MYMTKVWGFGMPVGPLQFSLNGHRINAREKLKPGDLVLLVGTQSEPTPVELRGRVLGLMEPSREPVASLDFDLKPDPEDWNENNEYKWPYALLNRRAWQIVGPPVLLKDVSSRQFQMDAALGIVLLTSEEEQAVLALPREEASLLPPTMRAQERLDPAAARRASPPPTFNRRSIMQMRDRPASTYAMAVLSGERVVGFKIGWAFEYQSRQKTFNRAALPALGGLFYKPEWHHRWDTAREAFRMEQQLLRRFHDARHRDNHEVIVGVSRDGLGSAWTTLIVEGSLTKGKHT
jgi:hypothetical protein